LVFYFHRSCISKITVNLNYYIKLGLILNYRININTKPISVNIAFQAQFGFVFLSILYFQNQVSRSNLYRLLKFWKYRTNRSIEQNSSKFAFQAQLYFIFSSFLYFQNQIKQIQLYLAWSNFVNTGWYYWTGFEDWSKSTPNSVFHWKIQIYCLNLSKKKVS
jgi:hypothetical protein